MHRLSLRTVRRRPRSRGQSLVEFALVLPVLLLLTLVAIDFGRVFLGWVNLQQMTRVAAGYASEHASAWGTPGDPVVKSRYQAKVKADATAINCDVPGTLPDPVISAGVSLGSPVTVSLSCEFHVVTPIVSSILGGTVLVSASTTYPVREGAVAVVPGGGAPIVVPPTARFAASPQSGWAPLNVTFTDQSLSSPTGYTWSFNAGPPTGTGTPSVSQGTALTKGPHTVTYGCTGSPGDTCTFSVSLSVSNAGGTDSVTKSNLITVTVPPATGPIADFTATPQIGEEPLTVRFDFVDLRGGAVTYTAYQWDFTNDGSFDATGVTTTHTYTTDGIYTVRLRVTDSTGATQTITKVGAVTVTDKLCTVPDFANVQVNNAQGLWTAAGFTTTVNKGAGNGNYRIHQQTITGGTIDPQPNGCASTITVGP
jgi:PKD repeat protein